MNRGRAKGGMKRRLLFLKHKFSSEGRLQKNQKKKSIKKNQTENESGMIRISAHPEAEKPEEQHHKTPQAHVKFLLELLWLLFDLWGLDT